MMQPNRHHKNRDPIGKEAAVKESHNVLSPSRSEQQDFFSPFPVSWSPRRHQDHLNSPDIIMVSSTGDLSMGISTRWQDQHQKKDV